MDQAFAVDLGGTNTRAAVVDREGRIHARVDAPTDTGSADAVLDGIAELIRRLQRDWTLDALGVGAAGTIINPGGIVCQAGNLPFSDTPIEGPLARRLGLRVAVDNDAACAALGEHVAGTARAFHSSVMITLGTGVGGGAIEQDRPIRGGGGAGELGHLVVAMNGRPCQGTCPGRGHVEGYISALSIGRRAVEIAAEEPESGLARAGRRGERLDTRTVLRLARDGDPSALAMLDEAADVLGATLVTVANAFAPQIITIGGGFGEAVADLILPRATEILRREAFRPMRDAPVVRAALGADAGLVGAAALTWLEW